MLKRARSKYITMGLVLKLVDIKESPLINSYWNTWHCCHALIQIKDLIVASYCKNRWCFVCNRIRTAESIKKYYPVIKEWKDKHFVTLTVPNCIGDDLDSVIDSMSWEIIKIRDLARKKGNKLIGIRKLEVTYNPIRKDFHPHYHFIVFGKDNSKYVLDQWLKRFPLAGEIAQDVRKANQKSIFELFKYFTKFTSSKSEDKEIYARALDTIFQAVKGRRTFQSFGFKLPPNLSISDNEVEELVDELEARTIYKWVQDFHDWFDEDTGESLTDYKPSDKLKELIEMKINLK